MMVVDILFLVGCLITWWGYVFQITKLVRTHSTKSLSMNWLLAATLSIAVVLPRAFTSGLWVWWFGSTVSFIFSSVIVILFFMYRNKYKER